LVAATLDATLVAKSARGERLIVAKDFFAGIMSTTLAEDELLCEARLPLLPNDCKFGFNEFSRRAGDFAMSAALVTYHLQSGKIADARVGVGGAEASPRRIGEAEAALHGQAPSEKVFRAAAEAAASAIDPLEDHQTNAEYRRDLVRAVVRRALEQSSR
jgi:carbon-monoxide dehydrogenase medium subunit